MEKPSWGEVFSDTVNTGIYLLEPEVLQNIPLNESFDFSKDLFPTRSCSRRRPCMGMSQRAIVKTWGTLRSIGWRITTCWTAPVESITSEKSREKQATDCLAAGAGTSIAADVVIEERSLSSAQGSRIGARVKLSNCVLGSRVTIHDGAELSGCVIWSNT